MSLLKAEHSFVKWLHSYCGAPRRYRKESLTERDFLVVRDAIKIWICILHGLTCVEDAKRNEGRLKVLAKSFDKVDLFDFLVALDDAADLLIQSVEDPTIRSYTALKTAIIQGDSAAEPLRLLMGLAKPLLQKWFLEKSETAFRDCRTIFCYLLRINLTGVDALANAAYEQWVEAEDNIRYQSELDSEEKHVITRWFPIEDTVEIFENFDPHHGPGTTFEGVHTSGEKYFLQNWDANLIAFMRIIGWDPFDTGLMQRMRIEIAPGCYPDPPGDEHKIHGVPKNWKVKRLVSSEYTARMFVQLGVNRAIQKYLKSGRCAMARHYCVDTEQKNRELARLGSINGDYVTIDLSHASDSVPYRLVADWFDDSALVYVVNLLRSNYAKFSLKVEETLGLPKRVSDVIRVQKYAPMGSGLCFIIECIIFCAIVESIARKTHDGKSHIWWVFGDDIVCSRAIADKVIARLTAIGFKVNSKKSFTNGPQIDSAGFFRESCGGEYLNGIDVTPSRISRKFCGFLGSVESYTVRGILDTLSRSGLASAQGACQNAQSQRASAIARLIELTNDLKDHRLAHTLVLSSLLSKKVPILFDETGERGVYSPSPTNFHLCRRYNEDYQRWEVLACVLHPRYKSLDYYEESYLGEVRLFEYLRIAQSMHRTGLTYPEDRLTQRLDPYESTLTIRYEWIESADTAL